MTFQSHWVAKITVTKLRVVAKITVTKLSSRSEITHVGSVPEDSMLCFVCGRIDFQNSADFVQKRIYSFLIMIYCSSVFL